MLTEHWKCPLGTLDAQLDKTLLEEVFTRTGIFYDAWEYVSFLLKNNDFEKMLSHLQHPMLLIEGEKITNVAAVKEWISKNKNASVEFIQGAGYCLACDPRFTETFNTKTYSKAYV